MLCPTVLIPRHQAAGPSLQNRLGPVWCVPRNRALESVVPIVFWRDWPCRADSSWSHCFAGQCKFLQLGSPVLPPNAVYMVSTQSPGEWDPGTLVMNRMVTSFALVMCPLGLIVMYQHELRSDAQGIGTWCSGAFQTFSRRGTHVLPRPVTGTSRVMRVWLKVLPVRS
jgi:hypothetical protein